jgi:hypothetical protein
MARAIIGLAADAAILALNVAAMAPLKHENNEIYSWLAIKCG